MNAKDREKLREILQITAGVSAHAASYDSDRGYTSNHAEASRLMDSADYRKGYEYLRARLGELVQDRFGVTDEWAPKPKPSREYRVTRPSVYEGKNVPGATNPADRQGYYVAADTEVEAVVKLLRQHPEFNDERAFDLQLWKIDGTSTRPETAGRASRLAVTPEMRKEAARADA